MPFTYFYLYIRILVVVPCGGPKNISVHPFNALIFPIFGDCLRSVCIFLSLEWEFLIAPFPINAYFLSSSNVIHFCLVWRLGWEIEFAYQLLPKLFFSIMHILVRELLKTSSDIIKLNIADTTGKSLIMFNLPQ